MPSYIKFYILNICQIRKSRIEIKASLVVNANAREAAMLTANNWYDTTVDIIRDSNNESDNDYAKIDLLEYEIYTKTLLADSIRETYCRWDVDDYTNSSKIDVITTLMTNLKYEISTNKDNSMPIYHCQVARINGQDKDNINNVS